MQSLWPWSVGMDLLSGENAYYTQAVTCYHPVKNEKGPLSAFNQQWQYLLQHNVDQCPLQQYMVDLKAAIEHWQDEGNFLIIGGDWN